MTGHDARGVKPNTVKGYQSGSIRVEDWHHQNRSWYRQNRSWCHQNRSWYVTGVPQYPDIPGDLPRHILATFETQTEAKAWATGLMLELALS